MEGVGYIGFGAVFYHQKLIEQLIVADSRILIVLYPILFFVVTLDIASLTPQSNHAYVIIRKKMSESVNGLTGCLFCHYGDLERPTMLFLLMGW